MRTRGAVTSPALELEATPLSGDQPAGTFGSVLHVEGPDVDGAGVDLRVTVRNGKGETLRLIRNGDDLFTVPVTSDPFDHTWTVRRHGHEGPLGTWYRVETFDRRGRTTIGNPVFLQEPPG